MKTALLALLVLTAPLGNERAERQLEHPWGRWQPGAWVETRTISAASPRGVVERRRLVRFDSEGYVLESAMVIDGADDVVAELRRSWAFSGYAHVMPNAQLVGQDAVLVRGKSVPCEVWEAEWSNKGETMVTRTWLAEGYDLPVRMRIAGRTGRIELALAEPAEYLRIGDRKLKTARYEGRGQYSQPVRVRQWLSLDVPGGVVRLESTSTKDGNTQTMRREVTSFRCEPIGTR